jgi:hypothetical protein
LFKAWDVVDAATGESGPERQNGDERSDAPKTLAKHGDSS